MRPLKKYRIRPHKSCLNGLVHLVYDSEYLHCRDVTAVFSQVQTAELSVRFSLHGHPKHAHLVRIPGHFNGESYLGMQKLRPELGGNSHLGDLSWPCPSLVWLFPPFLMQSICSLLTLLNGALKLLKKTSQYWPKQVNGILTGQTPRELISTPHTERMLPWHYSPFP